MFFYLILIWVVNLKKGYDVIQSSSKAINKNADIESKGISYNIWMINVINSGIVTTVNDNNAAQC